MQISGGTSSQIAERISNAVSHGGVSDLEPEDSWDRGQLKVRWIQMLVWAFAGSAGRSWADSGSRNLIFIL